MLRKTRALLALILMSAVAPGCAAASPGDKAGGPGGGPVVLRMASSPYDLTDTATVGEFVRLVGALSHGALKVTVISQWGDYSPDAETQVVRAVVAGTVDLGWAGSRVFDSMGVPDFRALSAPMLIDSYPLENAVLHSAMPGRMLAGLASAHVTGLGVLGDGLRLPISVQRPLLAPADWHGVSFGTYRSGIQEQAIRALGATPVVAFGPYRGHDLDSGQIQAFELDVQRYARARMGLVARAPYVTANVVLWPQFDVLVANPARLASFTTQQRAWLRQAADAAARDSVNLAASQNGSVRRACTMGARFVNATPADLAALRSSLSTVYQALQQDPRTSLFIHQIQRLKDSTQAGPAPAIPARCTRRR
jgi:TRAP-type C4-dicarboxylate transport system substrate-binding protein